MEKKRQNTDSCPVMSRSMLEGFRYKIKSSLDGHQNDKTNEKYISDLLSTGSDMIISEISENQPMTVPEVTINTTLMESQKPSPNKNTQKKLNAREEQTRQLRPANQAQNRLLAVQTNRSRPSSACSSRQALKISYSDLFLSFRCFPPKFSQSD